jgi:predicted lipid-binding transport protein (Tim44 family)
MTRRSITLRGALALALILCTVAAHATDAFARAGSGGSRGSRSYSRPAPPPASPATPSSPTRQYGAPTQAPAPAQPSRGWFGPVMGGLAGFMLGGLLGGLLFGHGFGAGFGLMDLLLLGGAAYLISRFMLARRAPQPAYGTAGAYGAGPTPVGSPYAPAETEGPSARAEAASVTAGPESVEAPSDLDRGLDHIRQMDPGFAPEALAAAARGLFAEVQRGIGARDVSPLRERLTPRMYTELSAQCDRLRAARRTNRVEQVDIRRADVSEAWQESGHDYVTVYLAGSLVDYTVDDASGAVVDGHRAAQEFEEFWTFTRPVGPNAWKLSAIQTAS